MPANIVIRIGAESSQAVSEIGKVNRVLGDQMTASQKASAVLKKAAVPAALALAAVGAAAVDATKAALADQAAQEKLAAQLGRVTDATAVQVAGVDDYITKMEFATGVTDDELRPALGKLATATGDLGKAQTELGIALDVSAQTGKSLDSVTTALAKGYTGNTGALNKLIPGLDQAVIKTKDMTKVNAELADLTGGAATEAASTAAGQYQVFTVRMQELKEQIGAGLIPIVEKLMPILSSATELVSKHGTAVTVVIGAVAALAAGVLIANAAMKLYAAGQVIVTAATKAWTAAQWLLDAALNANPIGLVIIAVAALAAGIVIAYQRSETFRNIVKAAMSAVQVAFDALLATAQTVFNWIKAHWQIGALALGPVGVAVALIATNFDKIEAAAKTAFSAILTAVGAVKAAIDAVVGAVEALISALGRIHVPSIHLPHIPNPFGLATIPTGFPGLPPAAALAGAPAAVPRASSSSSAGITVNVYGAIDPEGTARAVNRILRAHDRRIGRQP